MIISDFSISVYTTDSNSTEERIRLPIEITRSISIWVHSRGLTLIWFVEYFKFSSTGSRLTLMLFYTHCKTSIPIYWFLDVILKISVLQKCVNKLYLVNKQVQLFQNHQFCIRNQKVAMCMMLREWDLKMYTPYFLDDNMGNIRPLRTI